MKALIISLEGDGFGIADKLQREGHTVKMFIQSKKFKHSGKNIFDIVNSWRPVVEDVDLVICDMVGMGTNEKSLSRLGKPFIGCSAFADSLELDRAYGMSVMKNAGIGIPITYNYDNASDAIELLNDFPDLGLVIKPHNNQSTAKTIMAPDKDTFKWAIEQFDSNESITIQEIVSGVEVSCEGWFNGRDWIKPFNITFEEKRFMDGGKGSQTGCMGNVVLAVSENKLVRETLLKLTPLLKAQGYRGPIDINSIVNRSGIHGLEFTARFGYDAIEALMEGLKEDVFDLLFETALGVKKSMSITDDFMISVRMSYPPYPHADAGDAGLGLPIRGIDSDNRDHIYLTDVMKDSDGNLVYAAGDGVVLKAAARGRTIEEARSRVYRTVNNINFLDSQYRSDIGIRAKSDINKLKAWGYL